MEHISRRVCEWEMGVIGVDWVFLYNGRWVSGVGEGVVVVDDGLSGECVVWVGVGVGVEVGYWGIGPVEVYGGCVGDCGC